MPIGLGRLGVRVEKKPTGGKPEASSAARRVPDVRRRSALIKVEEHDQMAELLDTGQAVFPPGQDLEDALCPGIEELSRVGVPFGTADPADRLHSEPMCCRGIRHR